MSMFSMGGIGMNPMMTGMGMNPMMMGMGMPGVMPQMTGGGGGPGSAMGDPRMSMGPGAFDQMMMGMGGGMGGMGSMGGMSGMGGPLGTTPAGSTNQSQRVTPYNQSPAGSPAPGARGEAEGGAR